jgi:hypothetical protein
VGITCAHVLVVSLEFPYSITSITPNLSKMFSTTVIVLGPSSLKSTIGVGIYDSLVLYIGYEHWRHGILQRPDVMYLIYIVSSRLREPLPNLDCIPLFFQDSELKAVNFYIRICIIISSIFPLFFSNSIAGIQGPGSSDNAAELELCNDWSRA